MSALCRDQVVKFLNARSVRRGFVSAKFERKSAQRREIGKANGVQAASNARSGRIKGGERREGFA